MDPALMQEMQTNNHIQKEEQKIQLKKSRTKKSLFNLDQPGI